MEGKLLIKLFNKVFTNSLYRHISSHSSANLTISLFGELSSMVVYFDSSIEVRQSAIK